MKLKKSVIIKKRSLYILQISYDFIWGFVNRNREYGASPIETGLVAYEIIYATCAISIDEAPYDGQNRIRTLDHHVTSTFISISHADSTRFENSEKIFPKQKLYLSLQNKFLKSRNYINYTFNMPFCIFKVKYRTHHIFYSRDV